MKTLLGFATIALFLGCTDNPNSPTAVEPAAKKAPKVDVCHATGNGGWNLININGNALNAHLNHGDVLPGTEGLDENCDPAPLVCDVTFIFAEADEASSGTIVTWNTTSAEALITYTVQGLTATESWQDLVTVEKPGTGCHQVPGLPVASRYRVVATCDNGGTALSGEFVATCCTAPPACGGR